jgi:ADP-ribosylglycohydrolase
MPGGGTFNLVPGQVTDDSEIALCLANGLILGEGTLNLDHIAAQYRDWMQSFPFDIGSTIGSAFFPLYEVKKQVGEFPFSKAITKSAFKNNQLSESNGCLMRITPLAIWCRNLSEKDIKKAVKAEIRHTHPSKIVLKACFYWVLAIVKLMNLVDKPDKTEEENIKLRMETVYEEIKSKIQFEKEMDDWWKLVEENKYISANDRMGWMKIAWTYGFIFLKQRQIDYYEIIKDVISRGGDTDTNACIVGGMIGSAIGFKRIPLQYLEKMILCNSTIGCKPRKPFFNPRNGLILGDEIYEMAPKNLLIKSEDL